MKINIFWFRRDLRLNDNTGLYEALNSRFPVLPVFIFDTNIIEELKSDDPRITFIYDALNSINEELGKSKSSIYILKGDPETLWKELILKFDINAVYINKDYESYSIKRDEAIKKILIDRHIPLFRFKDQVLFEEREILKSDNYPYTVFTPYKNQWLRKLNLNLPSTSIAVKNSPANFHKVCFDFPSIEKTGFRRSKITVRPYDLSVIKEYLKFRDFPFEDKTSYLSPHLRFGTVSIRDIINIAVKENQTFLNELIWREFFMQILYNFPHVISNNFRPKFDDIHWINNENDFDLWCKGKTGYPLVDAGMRQLNKTGFMHNRIRMITAGFLCKHLLIDWRWGESYFAQKLLDYELSSNNGNWQWAAGTGCDAAPYFRIFNPALQQKKFDRNNFYVSKWIPEYGSSEYPEPIINHDFARRRAIAAYNAGIKRSLK